MKRFISFLVASLIVYGAASDADARPRRPKKDAEHYTFNQDRLADQLAAYRDRFDTVTLRDHLATTVSKGEGFCKLEWKGDRVDAVLAGDGDPHRVEIALPRGANVRELTAFAIGADGKTAEKFKEPSYETIGDTLLVVTVERPDAEPVVQIAYELEGMGISVDETFLFQPERPVLEGRYRFSIQRVLWQEASSAGLAWNFQAATQPNAWEPTRDDTPDFFTWAWRADDTIPAAPDAFRKPMAVTVTGFLPNALLASFESEELPDVAALEEVLAFQQRLERMMREQDMMEGASSIAAPPSRDTGPTSSSSGGAGIPTAQPK